MPWDPFSSWDEWELAKWLAVEGISKSAVDEFLKLKIVSEGVKESMLNLSNC